MTRLSGWQIIVIITHFAYFIKLRKVIVKDLSVWQQSEKCNGLSFFVTISLFMDETCDSEQITSLISHHIPDAKLKAKTHEKLEYVLPLGRTSKFPGNACD